jgi:hypothetical protein
VRATSERRVEAGGEVVQAKKLPLGGEGGVERRLHVGPDRAGWQLQVQVRPGAPARVREFLVPDGAGLDRVAGIFSHRRPNGEWIGPQRVQGEAQLRGDTQRQIQVDQVIPGQVHDAVAR